MIGALFDRVGRLFLVATTIVCFVPESPVQADGSPGLRAWNGADAVVPALLPRESGAVWRLDVANRLRTLSQQVASAGCRLHHGIASAESRVALFGARREMGHLLHMLEFGNPASAIRAPETRRATLRKLHDLRVVWEPARGHVSDLLEHPGNATALAHLYMYDDIFEQTASLLHSEISGQYSHPFELLQVDALMIDVAGRQAMLTQRIARLACEISAGAAPASATRELAEAVALLDRGLTALADGMPELGIPPAPTPAIDARLAAILAGWSELAPALVSITADTSAAAHIALRLDAMMTEMQRVARLYSEHAAQRS